MNKSKNKILSVLLLVFTFFVVHDFAIESFSDTTQNVASSIEISENIDLELHDNIHNMLEIHLPAILYSELAVVNTKPSTLEISSTSFTSFVLKRPPAA